MARPGRLAELIPRNPAPELQERFEGFGGVPFTRGPSPNLPERVNQIEVTTLSTRAS